MSDDQKELQIKITTGADLTGAQQTAAAVDRAAEGTKGLAEKTELSGKAAKESGEEFEKNREVFSEIDRIAPGLGESLKSAFEGPMGALVILALAINVVRDALSEYSKELDEVQKAELGEHEDTIKRLASAWDKAAEQSASYYARLTAAQNDQDPIATQLARLKQLTEAQMDASKKHIQALGEEEVARMRAMGATPEQIAQAQRQTQEQIAGIDQQRSQAAGSGLLEEEQRQRGAAAGGLIQKTVDAQRLKDEADKKFAGDQAQLERLRKLSDAGAPESAAPRERVEKAQREVDRARGEKEFNSNPMDLGNNPGADQRLRDAQAELDAAKRALDLFRQGRASLENSEQERAKKKDEADAAAAAAEAQSIQNQKRLGQLPGEIGQAKAVEGASAVGGNAQGAAQTASADLGLGEALARLSARGMASDEQNQRLIQIANQVAGHAVNLQTAIQIMENGAGNINIFMNQLSRLTAIFESWNPVNLSRMQSEIDRIALLAQRAMNAANLH